jgi:hypothetical protein
MIRTLMIEYSVLSEQIIKRNVFVLVTRLLNASVDIAVCFASRETVVISKLFYERRPLQSLSVLQGQRPLPDDGF